MIQTDKLTPAIIVDNITSLLEELEGNETLRAVGVLITWRSPDNNTNAFSSEKDAVPAQCCLGVACKQAGLPLNNVKRAYVYTEEGKYTSNATSIAPRVVTDAIGCYDVKLGELPGWTPLQVDGENIEDSQVSCVSSLMSLNDQFEKGDHWETGFVVNRLKQMRAYWQIKVDANDSEAL